MLRGMYTAASGMSAQLAAQEVVSNNLANANTTGYKKDITVEESFLNMVISRVNDANDRNGDTVIGALGTGVQTGGTHTDYANGSLINTGNSFDMALSGDGFFAIQTPEGERYTRDGSFTVNAQGDVVTKDGYAVLGRRGTVNVGAGEAFTVNQDGSVVVNGSVVNELQIVAPDGAQALRKIGNNLYALNAGSAMRDAAGTTINQGFLEASNVNVVSEMVNMISGMRVYEASQKAVRAQDDSLDLLLNSLGRV